MIYTKYKILAIWLNNNNDEKLFYDKATVYRERVFSDFEYL